MQQLALEWQTTVADDATARMPLVFLAETQYSVDALVTLSCWTRHHPHRNAASASLFLVTSSLSCLLLFCTRTSARITSGGRQDSRVGSETKGSGGLDSWWPFFVRTQCCPRGISSPRNGVGCRIVDGPTKSLHKTLDDVVLKKQDAGSDWLSSQSLWVCKWTRVWGFAKISYLM
jgi:hypothetical protein